MPSTPVRATTKPDPPSIALNSPDVPSSPRSMSLRMLVNLLASSRRLDSTIETSLSHLKPDPSDHQQLHNLRLALSHLTSEMTDHLATATSSLLELVDKGELTVLGEMYDIPVSGTFFYSRKPLSSQQSDNEDDDRTPQQSQGHSVPSPKRLRLSLSPRPPDLKWPNSQSRTESRSSSAHFKPSHRTHFLSLSLSPRLTSQSSASDDRFTSLPSRTPRISKRSSWNADTWSSTRTETTAPVSDVRSRRLSRPSHERRITEADEAQEHEEHDGQSNSSEMLGDSPFINASLPASPTPFRRATSRRSPLSGNLNDTSKLPSQPTLPSPPGLTTPKTKRRSLQNMPYNPPTEEPVSASAGLMRARSLPFSDIQSLRSRYATGNRSRATSAASLPYLDAAPTPRIRRMISSSPLTTPSLRAACLNIHLRRRRLACCLLGLRYTESSETYWSEINRALSTLLEQVDAERSKLEAAIDESDTSTATLSSAASQPLWVHRQLDSLGSIDFAPRTSDEIVLEERIDEIRASLEKTWDNLAKVNHAMGTNGLDDSWSRVRRGLGEMITSWEKGRNTVQQMTKPNTKLFPPPEESDATTPHATVGMETMPTFIKAWSDDSSGSPSTSFETDRVPASLDGQLDWDSEGREALPPRGLDEVFEADLEEAVQFRAKSGLSREERIQMVKEARAKGVTLNKVLSQIGGEDGGDGMGREDGEVQKQGGMVVDELRGLMDLIRAKKGLS